MVELMEEVPGAPYSSLDQKTEPVSEVGLGYLGLKGLLCTDQLYYLSMHTKLRFHSLPKQRHQLGTKYSNIQACVSHFTVKS